MEIPEINMIEAGMKCLENPSFISRFFAFPVPQVWKWGALIFAIFATFSSIIKRFKLILIRLHSVKPSLLQQKEEIYEFSDDEDDDISIASSDDEQEEENVPRKTTLFHGQRDFRVKGSRLCFKSEGNGLLNTVSALSEFACSKNVVKLWDSLGLSLDFDEDLFNYDPQSVVSTWDSDQYQKEIDRVWNIPAASSVFLTAERNGMGDGVVLGGFDTRMRRRVPALYAEWSSPSDKVAGVSTGGVGKVYFRDDVGGVLTVGDVRNVGRPLVSDGDTWWDSNAVTKAED